jgi:SAM-dependent methyltransferase
LGGTKDLKAGACCSPNSLSPTLREVLSEIDPEIVERFYGCDSPIPPAIEGCAVLDLGCGTGRDVYLCSKLVGPAGRAIGIDMTDEQLAVARKHIDSQTRRFGFDRPNVEFLQGYMEDLDALGIEDNSIDAVISNCVINLSPRKDRVFSEIFRVLKPGGELFFSDVFADRRIPPKLLDDPVLLGECLAGAMYLEDFRRLLLRNGVPDYRVVKRSAIAIQDEEIRAKVGNVNFSSITIRAFELGSLEDRCEDYGQVATYKGTLEDAPHSFALDDRHRFQTEKPMLVCGNTAAMIEETRFARHFEVTGDRSRHYGLFDCGSAGDEFSETSGSCC